jgi:hypothetical protein
MFSKRIKKAPRAYKKVDSYLVKEIIGPITSGCEIFGLTKGQISIIDIIRYVLEEVGPADLVISTWAAAHAHVVEIKKFQADGLVRKLRFLIDPSLISRHMEFCNDVTKILGEENIRTIRNHSKFILINNDEFNIVIRTSMNLNQNLRMEYAEISDDKTMFDFMVGIVDEIYEKISPQQSFQRNKGTNETILKFDSAPVTESIFSKEDLEMMGSDEGDGEWEGIEQMLNSV